MHSRLPTLLIFFFALASLFTVTRFALAYQENKTTHLQQTSSRKKIVRIISPKISQKQLPKPSQATTPTPTITKKPARPLGGISFSPTPTPIAPRPTEVPKEISPTPTPLPSNTPTPTTTKPTSDVTSYLIDEVNKYRASLSLSPVQPNEETCNFAKIRAEEISTIFNHDGFNSRVSSKTLPYASWSSVTENIAQTSTLQNVVPLWINSPGHAANMQADTPYVCIQKNGDYYAYEGMKP